MKTDRNLNLGKIVAKTGLRRELRRERLKFNTDRQRVEAIQLALEADELLEHQLSPVVELYATSREAPVDDSTWFQDFLEWLGSEDFQRFIETIINLIKTLVDLFGGVA